MIEGLRKAAGAPLEIGEDPIPIFPPYELETWLKKLIEIHRLLSCRSMRVNRAGDRVMPFADGGGVPLPGRAAKLVIYPG
jgi:hypothetical protein